MGCGGSSTSHFFSAFLLQFDNSEDEKIAKIVQKGKEVCKIVQKMTFVQYIKASSQNGFAELFQNARTLKHCVFILYYHGIKTKKICDYNEVYNNIPYDDMMLIDTNGLLEKAYIVDMRSAYKHNLKAEHVLPKLKDAENMLEIQLDVLMSADEKEEKRLNEEEKELEDEAANINEEDEKEIEGGIINLRKKNLKKYFILF
jgi:hypothetical protein